MSRLLRPFAFVVLRPASGRRSALTRGRADRRRRRRRAPPKISTSTTPPRTRSDAAGKTADVAVARARLLYEEERPPPPHCGPTWRGPRPRSRSRRSRGGARGSRPRRSCTATTPPGSSSASRTSTTTRSPISSSAPSSRRAKRSPGTWGGLARAPPRHGGARPPFALRDDGAPVRVREDDGHRGRREVGPRDVALAARRAARLPGAGHARARAHAPRDRPRDARSRALVAARGAREARGGALAPSVAPGRPSDAGGDRPAWHGAQARPAPRQARPLHRDAAGRRRGDGRVRRGGVVRAPPRGAPPDAPRGAARGAPRRADGGRGPRPRDGRGLAQWDACWRQGLAKRPKETLRRSSGSANRRSTGELRDKTRLTELLRGGPASAAAGARPRADAAQLGADVRRSGARAPPGAGARAEASSPRASCRSRIRARCSAPTGRGGRRGGAWPRARAVPSSSSRASRRPSRTTLSGSRRPAGRSIPLPERGPGPCASPPRATRPASTEPRPPHGAPRYGRPGPLQGRSRTVGDVDLARGAPIASLTSRKGTWIASPPAPPAEASPLPRPSRPSRPRCLRRLRAHERPDLRHRAAAARPPPHPHHPRDGQARGSLLADARGRGGRLGLLPGVRRGARGVPSAGGLRELRRVLHARAARRHAPPRRRRTHHRLPVGREAREPRPRGRPPVRGEGAPLRRASCSAPRASRPLRRRRGLRDLPLAA